MVFQSYPKKFNHAWYKFYLTLNPDFIKPNITREEIINELTKRIFIVHLDLADQFLMKKHLVQ